MKISNNEEKLLNRITELEKEVKELREKLSETKSKDYFLPIFRNELILRW